MEITEILGLCHSDLVIKSTFVVKTEHRTYPITGIRFVEDRLHLFTTDRFDILVMQKVGQEIKELRFRFRDFWIDGMIHGLVKKIDSNVRMEKTGAGELTLTYTLYI